MTTTGAPLNLTLPPSGEVGWTDEINANWTGINSSIAALQAGGTTGPKGDPGSAGAVGLIWAGPWGSGTPYVATDAVSYNGSSYLALASNTGVQPDTHPSTWALLALAGAQGPQGDPGPEGPPGSGGGTTITFPITVGQGGTGANDAGTARTNLGAAARGNNSDITSLASITAGVTTSGQQGITVVSPGGAGNAITVSNGTTGGGITTDGGFFAEYMECAGQITCGPLIAAGRFQTNAMGEATAGAGMTVGNKLILQQGMVVQGTAPVVAAGQIGVGGGTASTASAGGGQTVPATVLTWEIVNVGGVIGKRPIFAN